MKNIALFLLLASGAMTAQVTKNLGDFSQVKVFDQIQVTLVKSDQNKIEITGPNSDKVEFVTKNDLLKIRLPFTRTLDGDKTKATLYYKDLNDIDGSEGAYISSAETIKVPKITITAKEGAQIELNIDAQNANVKSVTGGVVRLSGTAENMKANVGTGGALEAKPLQTEQTEVSITTGGEASVTASDWVDASVKAGGNIRIYGNPKTVNKKTTLGGSIEVK